MKKFTQKPSTKRFIQVYELLLKKGEIKSQKAFCAKIHYLDTSFSSALKGNRDVPITAINGLCDEYNVSRDFIFNDVLPIFNAKAEVAKPATNHDNNELKLLRLRVEYLEKINDLLEKQNAEYEKQLAKKKP